MVFGFDLLFIVKIRLGTNYVYNMCMFRGGICKALPLIRRKMFIILCPSPLVPYV